MNEDEFVAFTANIATYGVRKPLDILADGTILDGRHRYEAAKLLNFNEIPVEIVAPENPEEYMIECAVYRRHLNDDQRAILAREWQRVTEKDRVATAHKKSGQSRRKDGWGKVSEASIDGRVAAAGMFNVPERKVRYATQIEKNAPELIKRVADGNMRISDAMRLAKKEEPERVEILSRIDSGEADNVKHAEVQLERKKQAQDVRKQPDRPKVYCGYGVEWIKTQPKCDLLITKLPPENDDGAFTNETLAVFLEHVKPTGRAYLFVEYDSFYFSERLSWFVQDRFVNLELNQILFWMYENGAEREDAGDYIVNWQAIFYFKGRDAPPLNCKIPSERMAAQDIALPKDRYTEVQHPSKLAERIIRQASKKGDLVLDPFCGTGTFILAAQKLGRIGIGCESNENMMIRAIQRGCEEMRQKGER